MKNKRLFILLQFIVFVYSFVGVLSKLASSQLVKYGVLSFEFIIIIFGMFLILGIYAILWQIILKKIDLSIAYANKGMGLLWTLVWATLLFNEKIYFQNIIGIILIMLGIWVVSTNGN
jgi:multidrug transporter EmrE-like cation transporter